MTHQTRAVRAGEYGEAAVREVFGLREPTVEVKTVTRHKCNVGLRMSQLEKMQQRAFVIVVYSRARYARKREGKCINEYKRSIADAFDEPLEFIFTDGAELARLAVGNHKVLRLIPDQRNNMPPKFYAVVPLRLLRDGRRVSKAGKHTVIGDPVFQTTHESEEE